MAKLSARKAKKRAKELETHGQEQSARQQLPRNSATKQLLKHKTHSFVHECASDPPAHLQTAPTTGPVSQQKKLRPSLQKLRITGFSKKRPASEAGVDDGRSKSPAKRQKGAAGTNDRSSERQNKDGKRGRKNKQGKKNIRPRPVVNDDRAREGNNEIAQYGNRKMLREAQDCFETAIKKNLANSHTYTIMINAHVRCGDADGASRVLKRMCKASLQPCVVAYTTLINGKCRAGDLQGGLEVLRAMLERRPPVLPNVRTVNTLLRGCLLVGAVSEAKSLLDRMREEWNAEPDASTYEYVISLLSQDLRLGEAANIVDELRRTASIFKREHDTGGEGAAGARTAGASSHAVASASSPALYVSMARGAALLADWPAFTKAQKRAVKALKEGAEAGKGGGFALEAGRGSVEGGKQGWRVRDDSRQTSAHVFDAHRRDELQVLMVLVLAFLLVCCRCDANPNFHVQCAPLVWLHPSKWWHMMGRQKMLTALSGTPVIARVGCDGRVQRPCLSL